MQLLRNRRLRLPSVAQRKDSGERPQGSLGGVSHKATAEFRRDCWPARGRVQQKLVSIRLEKADAAKPGNERAARKTNLRRVRRAVVRRVAMPPLFRRRESACARQHTAAG